MRCLLALAAVMVFAEPSFAQETIALPNTGKGIGMGLSILGLGIGLGLIGFSALSGIARQPEQTNTIRGLTILLAALVEGAAIVSLILCLIS